MLHPSYKEMIDKMNDTKSEGDAEIHSRYSLVIAAAKRARQINSGSEPLVDVNGKEKNLSTAVDELFAGKVHILEGTEASSDEANENDRIVNMKPAYSWDSINENDDYSESDDPDFADESGDDEESEEDESDTEVY